ncbi:MAG TPA: ferritin-like domain-containing protein [Gammaproteobacteria bacterium]|nr:ferritin-like domain-containing protein [Gammaproteobacteria bacterium]
MAEDQNLIAKLNDMLRQEHACAIRYATHAAVLTGPASESIKARLKEIAGDEIEHAEKLRDRIVALGGKPTMEVHVHDLKEAYDLPTILQINMREEADAIRNYTEILEMIPENDVILYETMREIIEGEQEHLEELSKLKG